MNPHILYIAILNGDEKTIGMLVRPLIKRLVWHLITSMGAQKDDALDVVQNTLMYVFQRIREKKIRDPERIYHYILIACKHNYLRLQYDRRRYNYNIEIVSEAGQNEPQLEDLLAIEKREMLSRCISELQPGQRALITYLIENPDAPTDQVADHFKISINNAWVRKHRLISILSKCVDRRLNQ